MPDAAVDDLLAFVFLGSAELAAGAAGEDATRDRLRYLRAWIRHFARYHIETSNAYNAAKHGLTTRADHARISFVAEDDEVSTGGEVVVLAGAVLETLEHEKRNGAQEWFRVVRTIDPPGLLASVYVAAELFDSAWGVARGRFLGETSIPLSVLPAPLPQDVQSGHYEAWGAMKVPLALLPLEEAQAQQVLTELLGEEGDGPEES